MDTQEIQTTQEPRSLNPRPSAGEPAGIEAEINTLRTGIYVLGAAFLLLSLFFTVYIYKQNNLLISQIDTQTRMLNQNEPIFESNRQRLSQMVLDLRTFAQTHNDIVPILVNHNLVRVQTQPSMTPPPSAPAR